MKILLTIVLFLFIGSQQCFATFSIVAVDPETDEVGSAGASCLDDSDIAGGVFIISRIHPGKGAINTQSYWVAQNQTNASTGLLNGLSPQETIDLLYTNDAQSDPEIRQYGFADFDDDGNPRTAAFTGLNCFDEKGHVIGETYAIQGNILITEGILDAMAAAFEDNEGEPLAIRLMAALQAANSAGADFRCLDEGVSSQSAFIRVAKSDDAEDDLWLDLLVSSTPFGEEPIDALQLLFDEWVENVLLEDCEELPLLSELDQFTPVIPTEAIFAPIWSQLFQWYSWVSLDYGMALSQENDESKLTHTTQAIGLFTLDHEIAEGTVDKQVIRDNLATKRAAIALYENEEELNSDAWHELLLCDPSIISLNCEEMHLPGSEAWFAAERNATYGAAADYFYLYGIGGLTGHPISQQFSTAFQSGLFNAFSPTSGGSGSEWARRYFIVAVECYFGMWAHDPNGNGLAGDNEYYAINRTDMQIIDPEMYSLIQQICASSISGISIEAYDDFEGTLWMQVNEEDYTHHSRYYTKASLHGTKDAHIRANNFDNLLFANQGNNSVAGYGGNDNIYGGMGEDTLVLQGNCGEYSIEELTNSFLITDLVDDRDDIDEARDVEWVRFADCILPMAEIVGIDERSFSINIFPNPVSEVSLMYWEAEQAISRVRLQSIDGRLILQKKIAHSLEGKLDLDHLESGLYLLELQNSTGQSSIHKIIVE